MKLITSLLLAFSVILVTACGGSSAGSEMKSVMEDMASTLKGITDVDSAKAAKDDLAKVVERMNALSKDAAANPPKEGDVDEAEAKAIGEATQAYTDEMMRLMQKPEIAEVLAPVFDKMGK